MSAARATYSLRPMIGAEARGRLLVSAEPLSFWGGYDSATGEIIDRRHPLSGQSAAGAVLVIPGTKGSSTTTAVLLEAIRAGTAPAAIVSLAEDRFLALASIVADEMYGRPLPLFVASPADAQTWRSGLHVTISAEGEMVVEPDTPKHPAGVATAVTLIAMLAAPAVAPTVVSARQDTSVRAALAAVRCGDTTLRRIDQWQGRLDESLLDAPGPDGSLVARVPTATLGVWLWVAVDEHTSTSRVVRVTRGGAVEVTWDARCAATETDRPMARADAAGEAGASPAALTDDDVARYAAPGPVAFYVWSPHMPLSLDGYVHAAAAADDTGVVLVGVLDPFADLDYARRMAVARGLPASIVRPFDSVELSFRGLTTHAPAIIVYAAGQVRAGPVFGFRERVAYRALFREARAGTPDR